MCELAAAGAPKPEQADVPQIAEPVPVTGLAPATWTISTLEISTLEISTLEISTLKISTRASRRLREVLQSQGRPY